MHEWSVIRSCLSLQQTLMIAYSLTLFFHFFPAGSPSGRKIPDTHFPISLVARPEYGQ